MAYTVKQLAAMSGVSVRTLHFYDETGLLEPAYCGANGYRFYEKQQLLMFRGFKAAEGKDRFEERIEISGDLAACKVSAQDTQGAMCVFELTGGHYCGPRHMHHDQDEWIYIIDGECDFEIGGQLLHAHTGDTVFLPRKVVHGWTLVGNPLGKVLNTYQPAGKMEDFFREVGRFTTPPIHEVLGIDGLLTLFKAHGMELSGAPLSGEWSVDSEGRITQIA